MKKLVALFCLVLCVLSIKAVPNNPVANPSAIVLSGYMRFTVLTPEIIRIERSTLKKFEDRASFVVINRDLSRKNKRKFTVF